ncbi:MAG: molybdopterin-dependent oxidoreductase [Desulfobacterales bacterium]|nr:molybdopterin-dependent oxidoreductase [Desulfobacterales bacterium]
MTQHWIDIRNADVVMIIGSNAAENHPMSFKWVQKAIDKGGTLISVDPRFTRSSSKAHLFAHMRSGTDIAFIGGIINYALQNNLYNEKYVKECTNALFKINTGFQTCAEGDLGVFSGLDKTGGGTLFGHDVDCKYNKSTWAYQGTAGPPFVPVLAADLNDPDCAFQLLKKQFAPYTINQVCEITGSDPVVYEQICQAYCATYPDDKSATIMYAMGTTQHTVGTQNVRSYAILQLLLGNIGVAGGGINALRGQDNVQGSTDMCILEHILPGYIKQPTGMDVDMATFIANWADSTKIIEPAHDYTVNGTPGTDPASSYWWQHGEKYMASLIKAWWPTEDLVTGYNRLAKKVSGKNYSMLSIFDAMYHSELNGFICDGENPAVSDPDSKHVRAALRNLQWMVVIDPFKSETARFWEFDVDGNPLTTTQMAAINTTVYLLPAAVAYERAGSRSNSGRWAQWHWKAAEPPGVAKDDLVIITELGLEIQAQEAASPGIYPQPITNLNWPYFSYNSADDAQTRAEKAAMEVNGYYLNPDGTIDTTVNPSGLVPKFTLLTTTGTTCSGNWLYCAQFVDPSSTDGFETANPGMFAATVGNRMARRHCPDAPNGGPLADPSYPNIGLHSYWSWCWPLNRRIIYNRASTYQSDGGANGNAGAPLAPSKYVMRYNGGWKGDVPDHGAAPGGVYPFIMHKEGHAHLFGPGRAEGPFPSHYEPIESVVANPMGNYQVNPIVHIYDGAVFTDGLAPTPEFPIAATTYRLTEHWHTGSMTRNLPWCNQVQPEPFVEMSEELAALKGINNGDPVKVSCARGDISVKACVTKRFKPFQLNGQTVHQVGVIWHWGYATPNPGDSGNVLTPFVGDANTRIQESKAFLVNIEKVVP